MDNDKLADFLQFAKRYRKKFEQIARATNQEYTSDDAQNEAWILVEVWEPNKAPTNLHNPQDIDRLFAYLCTKLVKHSEKNIRYSVRLDHSPYGDCEDEANPLMNKLTAPENIQPLEMVLAR